MKSKDFRTELVKIMPGYVWTVHKTTSDIYMKATGIQSSGFNRLSTLVVTKTERDSEVSYEAKSAGYGMRAKFLHAAKGRTIAQALRGLQDHYEAMTFTYKSHASSLQEGRKTATTEVNGIDTNGKQL